MAGGVLLLFNRSFNFFKWIKQVNKEPSGLLLGELNDNRFFIETRCDEKTSIAYGEREYIECFASLILLKHNNSSTFFCSAIANSKNNIARIKLLKEKRKMMLRKN
ncbi:MAG: hypothetical protein JKX78_06890 [Alteromonadaceae bacterium]|nr:hypothetical protein [Alteromonadaceae bacterium]